ncbi:hypothetical protein ACF0H5_003207 [Mactra antiquata]
MADKSKQVGNSSKHGLECTEHSLGASKKHKECKKSSKYPQNKDSGVDQSKKQAPSDSLKDPLMDMIGGIQATL